MGYKLLHSPTCGVKRIEITKRKQIYLWLVFATLLEGCFSNANNFENKNFRFEKKVVHQALLGKDSLSLSRES